MVRARLTPCAAAASVTLLAACGSLNPAASGTPGTSSPQAARTPSAAVPAASSTGPVPASPAGPTPAATPSAAAAACAALARHAFLRVTAVRAGTNGVLTVTGNRASVVCGGPDDYHYDLAATTVTGHVTRAASIEVFPLPAMHLVAIAHDKLASYLATDQDTRIFLVTGPLSRITALQEEFHP